MAPGCFHFINEDIGFFTTYEIGLTVYKTVNGGLDWTEITSGTFDDATNGITITPEIEKKLKGFSPTQKKDILKRAWDACCDGEWLGHYCKENSIPSDIDFWDGNHEKMRLSLEKDCALCLWVRPYKQALPLLQD